MNKCINNVIINDTPIEDACKDHLDISIVELMRNLKLTCRFCMYAESIDNHEDGYKCNHFSHNRKYAVMSGDYCSKFVWKDNE